jgi:predicted  nucleic acid-binding Zn-ribbon protein
VTYECGLHRCGAVLRASFEWFAQVPVDRVMLARRDQWRRPHRDAFNVLEDKVTRLTVEADDARQTAIYAAETSNAALSQVKTCSDRATVAEKAQRILEVQLKTTTKASAQRLEEATIAQAIAAKQAADMIQVRTDHEKTLRELATEERKRKKSDEAREKLEKKVAELEKEVNEYIKQLKGTRAAKRAQKIAMRNKILLGNVAKYEEKYRKLEAAVLKENERVNEGIGLPKKLARAMGTAQQEDRELATQPASGGATVKCEADVLTKYVQASKEFTESTIGAAKDNDTCIDKIEQLIEGFNMADQLPDSDSDGEAAEIEQLKKDNDYLMEKQFNNGKLLETKARELSLRQEAISRLQQDLRLYDEWKKRVEMEVVKIKEDANRQLRILQDEMEKMKTTMTELKMREQGFKDQIRQLEKDVAARDKEISQFELKLQQFKNQIKKLEDENQQKAQKISTLEHTVQTLKAEMQSLKEENKSMQGQIKNLNTRIHELEAELAAEREKVVKLRHEIDELQRQIKLLEERAREHAAEMKRAKEAFEKAAEEAKQREQKLQREKKELEDRIAKLKRELAEAENKAAEALKKQQVCVLCCVSDKPESQKRTMEGIFESLERFACAAMNVKRVLTLLR